MRDAAFPEGKPEAIRAACGFPKIAGSLGAACGFPKKAGSLGAACGHILIFSG